MREGEADFVPLRNGESPGSSHSQARPRPLTLPDICREWSTLPHALMPRHAHPALSPLRSGDRGFDPLSLGSNPETLKYFAEGEITNGRWAMTAVFGILVADLLGKPSFWTAGAEVRAPPHRFDIVLILLNQEHFCQSPEIRHRQPDPGPH